MAVMKSEELKKIPSKFNLEQFDVAVFAKDKIREMFRTGKLPTADAMAEEVILRAVKEGASDIHFEPTDFALRIRLGYEGVMKKLVSLPKDTAENLANVLKAKAGLNAFEKKKPQEGRFTIILGNVQLDLRISTLPAVTGERIALRILTKASHITKIEELGFSEANLERMKKLYSRPSGLLLITGPAGSGKTTTAYATVNKLNTPEKNIFTVENPIEFKLDFATQVQPSTDKTFTAVDALRSILRQSPNVILVGDIRDAETGNLTAEAAFIGTMVISTMLSSDAIGTIPRLLNFGISPYWLASSLVGIAHQQLVRKVCEACKEEYQAGPEELELLGTGTWGQTQYYRGKGCEACNGTGYHERTAIQEILVINDQIRDLIYEQAPSVKLKEAAFNAGFEEIRADAKSKVTDGTTTIAEFVRSLG
jgi:type IV pilus assembly protein PilB